MASVAVKPVIALFKNQIRVALTIVSLSMEKINHTLAETCVTRRMKDE